MLAPVYRAATADARSALPDDPPMMKSFTDLIKTKADLYRHSGKSGLGSSRNTR